MSEVQAHGFTWEKDILKNVYGATQEDLGAINYTSKMDFPANLNRLNPVDLSIKTTGSSSSVCMGSCLRFFDEVTSGQPIHLVVIQYKQEENIKRLVNVVEVDLTSAPIFGILTLEQLQSLNDAVIAVPHKRKPTPEEYDKMYGIRNSLQPLSSHIRLDIKCNHEQSRLQCSFNHFQDFLKAYPERIISRSTTGEFRGGKIMEAVVSARRVFRR